MTRLFSKIRPIWIGLVFAVGLIPVGVAMAENDSSHAGAVAAASIDAGLHAPATTESGDPAGGLGCTAPHCAACAAFATPVDGNGPVPAASHSFGVPATALHRPPEPRFRPPIGLT